MNSLIITSGDTSWLVTQILHMNTQEILEMHCHHALMFELQIKAYKAQAWLPREGITLYWELNVILMA